VVHHRGARFNAFLIFTGASMMTISSRAAAAAVASLLLASSAFAQTTTAPSAPAATTPAKKAEKPRSPESIECSKQADEKGLHGKARHKFRSQCVKDAKAAAAKSK
jgi:psiF repeat